MDESVNPDAFSFRSGVTTMVDAGSSGWKDFPDFRDHILKPAKTRMLAFLNIVASGMGTGHENDPAEMDAENAARVAKENPDFIVGFKSAHYAGPGWAAIDGAVKAGNATNLPVMVDFGNITKDRNLDILLLDKLRPGDIYTHCFSGHREEVLENGTLNPAMVEGRKRKIIFDIGFGQASFYWYVAVPAYKAGFHPDSISTDLHTNSMNGGMKNIEQRDVRRLWPSARLVRRDSHDHVGARPGDQAAAAGQSGRRRRGRHRCLARGEGRFRNARFRPARA